MFGGGRLCLFIGIVIFEQIDSMEFFNTLETLKSLLVKNTNKGGKAKSINILLAFVILSVGNLKAQYNLVPNQSFETYIVCPNTLNDIPAPPPWYRPCKYGPLYANACCISNKWGVPYNRGGANYQYAKTGDAYIGLFFINGPGLNRREYYQIKLKDSLRMGHCYYAEFFVSTENDMKLGCNNISMLLTNKAVYVDTMATPYGVLQGNAQVFNYGNPIITDTLNWVKVSSVFVAQGGEQYITLGNFRKDNQTSYMAFQATGYLGAGYTIDDVSIIPLDSMPLKADAGRDTTIHIGDSAFIGSLTNGITNIAWYNAAGQKIDSVQPGFYVHPTASTFYVVEQTVCGYYSRDTVNVTVGTVPLKFINYSLRQAQGDKVENRWTTANETNVSHFNIQRSNNGKDFTTIGTIKANNKSINEYSYEDNTLPFMVYGSVVYYRIVSVDRDGKTSFSEVRIIEVRGTNYEVRLFPNPAKDVVNVECKEGVKEVKIIDMFGKEISHFVRNDGNIHRLSLNTSHYSKGLYIVQVITKNGEVRSEELIIL